MQRNDWKFTFTAKKLAEAAAGKKQFHEGRLQFWSTAKEKVMTEVKESGIDVLESDAGSNYAKSGFTPQVMVRGDLQKRLTECHSKIQEHHGKVREYEGWIQVLTGNQESHLPLNADDYLYFFPVDSKKSE